MQDRLIHIHDIQTDKSFFYPMSTICEIEVSNANNKEIVNVSITFNSIGKRHFTCIGVNIMQELTKVN